MPATFYSELNHRMFVKNVLDLTPGSGTYGELCITEGTSYYCLALTEHHATERGLPKPHHLTPRGTNNNSNTSKGSTSNNNTNHHPTPPPPPSPPNHTVTTHGSTTAVSLIPH